MASSLGAGLSQSLIQVIVFRSIQGIGGAGLYSMAFISLPEITPPEKFPLMAAVLGIAFAVSAVLSVSPLSACNHGLTTNLAAALRSEA